ncbi:hypothetical protein [Lachnospira eligens]|uniref:hypothetical protein n=1 Tax=Lachnospira eligens TaxID=39485 RepID=UPI000E47F1A7|nr:hypothetical protein [Lachnospira eligens]RHM11183.1 hypothetical protein DWZ79_09530 [Lachnospira eligens]
MIKKNLFKTMTLIVLCTMVFAGCGRKKVTVDTSIQQESRAGDSKDDKKKVASNQEQVTVAVKDADGNTVEVAGIVETKDNGEKVVVVTDSDGNRTEISAGGFTSGDNKTITITDEKASETISSAAAENKVPKADEIIEIPDNGNNNNGSGNDSGNGSSGNSDGNGSSSGSNNGGSSSSGNNGNISTPDTPSHTHNWKPVYGSPIHHEAVTHDEDRWVVDKPAWKEAVYKNIYICRHCRDGRCDRCKSLGITQYEYENIADFDAHQDACLDENGSCFSFLTYEKIDHYIYHDEEGHNETITIVDKEAWDEQVIDHYECDCGETK